MATQVYDPLPFSLSGVDTLPQFSAQGFNQTFTDFNITDDLLFAPLEAALTINVPKRSRPAFPPFFVNQPIWVAVQSGKGIW